MIKAIKELYWQKALLTSQEAIKNGKLKPIETSLDYIKTEDNILFEQRNIVKNSFKFSTTIGPKQNPFKPWDKRLEIDLIGDKHVLILNKYPVQKGHMLLISKFGH